MFWKLCKHELKCSYRGFLILYAITLLLAVMINPSIDSMFVVTLTLIYGLLLCVILIMSMYVIIKNYHTSMFAKPAYLTHTLPVSTTKLLIVKILVGLIWFALSYGVILASIIVIGLSVDNFDLQLLFKAFSHIHISWGAILYAVYTVLGVVESITLLYLVIDITHTTHIQRFRVPIAIVLFLIISWVSSEIMNMFINPGQGSLLLMVTSNAMIGQNINTTLLTDMTKLLILCGWELLLVCLYFFSGKYLIDHKIEVE